MSLYLSNFTKHAETRKKLLLHTNTFYLVCSPGKWQKWEQEMVDWTQQHCNLAHGYLQSCSQLLQIEVGVVAEQTGSAGRQKRVCWQNFNHPFLCQCSQKFLGQILQITELCLSGLYLYHNLPILQIHKNISYQISRTDTDTNIHSWLYQLVYIIIEKQTPT